MQESQRKQSEAKRNALRSPRRKAHHAAMREKRMNANVDATKPWNVDGEMRLYLCPGVVKTLAELDERDYQRRRAR